MGSQNPSLAEIQRLVVEFLERRKKGEKLTAAQFAGQHSDLGQALCTRLEEAERMSAPEVTSFLSQSPRTIVDGGEEAHDTLRSETSAGRTASPEATLKLGEDPGSSAPARVIDGRYEVVRLLGEGGFGQVHLVRDRLYQGELRALKTVLAKHTAKPEFEKRFQNEIRVLRALAHKGIPQVHNDGKTADGDFYYTMAFIEGRTLDVVLRKEAPLRPARIVHLVRQLLEILEYAHGKGVVHRDLKPANVMLVQSGTQPEQVKILDFGIAKVLQPEGDLEAVNTMNTIGGIGTPHYMSPEQIRGQDVDSRTDIYALGIIIYQMCSGLLPFSGKTDLEIATARLERAPTPLPGEGTPDWLRQVVMQLLERNREKRPSTKAIHEQFERLAGGQRDIRKTLRWVAAGVIATGVTLAWLLLGGGERLEAASKKSTPSVPPVAKAVSISSPSDRAFLSEPWAEVAGEAPGREQVKVNDITVPVADGRFSTKIKLTAGECPIIVRDPADGDAQVAEAIVVVDLAVPELRFEPPGSLIAGSTDRRLLPSRIVLLKGEAHDEPPGEIDPDSARLGEAKLTLEPDGSFAREVTLDGDGEHVLNLSVADRAGNVGRWNGVFVVDTTPPRIEIPEGMPADTDGARVTLRGRIVDAHTAGLALRADGKDSQETLPLRDGSFERVLELAVGENRWWLVASDAAGNRSESVPVSVTRTKRPISVENTNPVSGWSAPSGQDKVTLTGVADQDLSRLKVNGVEARIEDGRKFRIDLELKQGGKEFEILPFDADGVEGTPYTITLKRESLKMPPGCDLVPGAGSDPEGRAQRILHVKTGIELVLVPGGTAALSSGSRALDAFYLAKTEVTRAQYAGIAGAMPDASDSSVSDTHPVVSVSFVDSRKFCESAGLRLPTEDEWEYAGRGAQGAEYPWGNGWTEGACNANSSLTVPVGAHPRDASWCGILDLAGNVSEWCTKSGGEDQPALRGGSWSSDGETCKLELRKKGPSAGSNYVGFRVCLDAPH